MRRKIERLKDILLFQIGFIRSPSTVGAIAPSSSRLTNKIIRKIFNHDVEATPFRYLEIGAGTGVITEKIIRKLRPMDSLDIVEYDSNFCTILRRKFGHLANVTIHEGCILDFQGDKYDVVISGLPLNSFTSEFVDQVLAKYLDLTKKGGYISYFEYMGLPKIKQFFLSGESLGDFRAILGYKKLFLNHYGEETDKIWLNWIPAAVHHCKIQ
ncbi:MAG: methyltransferase domain-containing protein [Chlamydiales bacterium]